MKSTVTMISVLLFSMFLFVYGCGDVSIDNDDMQATDMAIGGDYTVGGTITGLGSNDQMRLQLGSDIVNSLIPTENGAFTFNLGLQAGDRYTVFVKDAPQGMTCSVYKPSGTIGAANITNVVIHCDAEAYQVGIKVNAFITNEFEHITLNINGGEAIEITKDEQSDSSDGYTYFPTKIPKGAKYVIAVTKRTGNIICASGSARTMGSADAKHKVYCPGIRGQWVLNEYTDRDGETYSDSADKSAIGRSYIFNPTTEYYLNNGQRMTGLFNIAVIDDGHPSYVESKANLVTDGTDDNYIWHSSWTINTGYSPSRMGIQTTTSARGGINTPSTAVGTANIYKIEGDTLTITGKFIGTSSESDDYTDSGYPTAHGTGPNAVFSRE